VQKIQKTIIPALCPLGDLCALAVQTSSHLRRRSRPVATSHSKIKPLASDFSRLRWFFTLHLANHLSKSPMEPVLHGVMISLILTNPGAPREVIYFQI
jgi:hypothetical protein